MEKPMADVIYDERAAGAYIGGADSPISERTFQRWRQRGFGPKFLRVGNQIRYRQRDLDEWLSDRVAQSTADRVRARP
jgi:Helix-turn-helix domain